MSLDQSQKHYLQIAAWIYTNQDIPYRLMEVSVFTNHVNCLGISSARAAIGGATSLD